jgi:5-deoxy-glucuronate isomerase
MKIPNPGIKLGYTPITKMDALDWNDPKNPLMDFGVLILDEKQTFLIENDNEKCVLLLEGNIELSWWETPEKKEIITHTRSSCFDENPLTLLVSKNYNVNIEAVEGQAELIIIETINDQLYTPQLFKPDEIRSEDRGKGTMREASTRIVRTIFDYSNAPKSKLVLGEVVNFPGLWSSYPPHHHPQPEIYHYRFKPRQGFGFGMMGDDVAKIKEGDSTLILNDVSHPQCAAPGYAMFYVWAIRHLDGNPYGPVIFEDEHKWVMDKDSDKKMWPPRK